MEFTLNLHNDISEIPRLTEWIEMLGESMELPMPAVFQVNLALEEAVVNVMNYAYPGETGRPVTLSVDGDSKLMTFQLMDEGIAFDPTSHEAPDLTLSAEERPIGGLGIFLVEELMKEVRYERSEDGKNILTMIYEPK